MNGSLVDQTTLRDLLGHISQENHHEEHPSDYILRKPGDYLIKMDSLHLLVFQHRCFLDKWSFVHGLVVHPHERGKGKARPRNHSHPLLP